MILGRKKTYKEAGGGELVIIVFAIAILLLKCLSVCLCPLLQNLGFFGLKSLSHNAATHKAHSHW
jgi:hypothetical protein